MRSKPLPLPDFEKLNSLFVLQEGVLFNKVKRKMSPAGIEAGMQKNGYRWVKIDGQRYAVHRIIFFMTHGFCPDLIDHIDGNGLNNKPNNLRAATLSENKFNQKIYKNNTLFKIHSVLWSQQKKMYKPPHNMLIFCIYQEKSAANPIF